MFASPTHPHPCTPLNVHNTFNKSIYIEQWCLHVSVPNKMSNSSMVTFAVPTLLNLNSFSQCIASRYEQTEICPRCIPLATVLAPNPTTSFRYEQTDMPKKYSLGKEHSLGNSLATITNNQFHNGNGRKLDCEASVLGPCCSTSAVITKALIKKMGRENFLPPIVLHVTEPVSV